MNNVKAISPKQFDESFRIITDQEDCVIYKKEITSNKDFGVIGDTAYSFLLLSKLDRLDEVEMVFSIDEECSQKLIIENFIKIEETELIVDIDAQTLMRLSKDEIYESLVKVANDSYKFEFEVEEVIDIDINYEDNNSLKVILKEWRVNNVG